MTLPIRLEDANAIRSIFLDLFKSKDYWIFLYYSRNMIVYKDLFDTIERKYYMDGEDDDWYVALHPLSFTLIFAKKSNMTAKQLYNQMKPYFSDMVIWG